MLLGTSHVCAGRAAIFSKTSVGSFAERTALFTPSLHALREGTGCPRLQDAVSGRPSRVEHWLDASSSSTDLVGTGRRPQDKARTREQEPGPGRPKGVRRPLTRDVAAPETPQPPSVRSNSQGQAQTLKVFAPLTHSLDSSSKALCSAGPCPGSRSLAARGDFPITCPSAHSIPGTSPRGGH